MNEVVVSVVMCCYNEQNYIRESIESVLAQTFCNFEFIIWNDGSTDETENIIKSYKDERIRYFYHENTGLGEALRLACQQVQGKYIARMDCDDICMPERLQKQVSFMESHSDFVLISSANYFIDKNGNIFGRRFPATWNYIIKHRLTAITHPATMFRTEAYIKAGGYRALKCAEDRILWTRLIPYGKFGNLKEPLIKYRVLDSSLSHIISADSPYFKLIETIREKMCEDKEIQLEDIKLHNIIYETAKKYSSVSNSKQSGVHRTIEELIYTFCKKVFGGKIAADIVYIYKNLYLTVLHFLQHIKV